MQQIKYFCDHCGNEITNGYGIEAEINIGAEFWHTVDLCETCQKELGKLVKDFTSAYRRRETVDNSI